MEYTLPDLYEVEKIITSKYYKNKKYYLIKWLCYPINQSTWEPKSNLKNLNHLIEQFEAQYPYTIDKSMYNIFCNEIKIKKIKKEKKEIKSINSHIKYLKKKRNLEKFDENELTNMNLDRLKMHLHIKIDKANLKDINNIKNEKSEFIIDLSDGNNKFNSYLKKGNENSFEENKKNINELIKPNII